MQRQRPAGTAMPDVAALIAAANDVSRLCRAPAVPSVPAGDAGGRGDEASSKLRRVVDELVATEGAYVAGLAHLLNRYVQPLRDEPFLSRCSHSRTFLPSSHPSTPSHPPPSLLSPFRRWLLCVSIQSVCFYGRCNFAGRTKKLLHAISTASCRPRPACTTCCARLCAAGRPGTASRGAGGQTRWRRCGELLGHLMRPKSTRCVEIFLVHVINFNFFLVDVQKKFVNMN